MPRRRTSFLILGLLFFPAVAQASCGSAVCSVDTRTPVQSDKGWVRLGYEFEYIDQNQPRIGTKDARVGEIRGHHDEQRTINRLHRFLGTWDVSDRLSLDLALPVISRSHRHLHNHGGGVIPEGWDFTGVGDLFVQGRYAFFRPVETHRPTLSGILGAEFPTGKSRVVNADGNEAEPGITPGSASYDVLIGGASLQHFSVLTLQEKKAMMPFFLSVTYKIHGKGHDEYLLGNILSANVGITYPILNRLGLIGQINGVLKEKDGAGTTSEEVQKTGGEYLYASPGIQVRLTERLDWSTLVQLPVRQRVNEIQITSDYNLLTHLSYKFPL